MRWRFICETLPLALLLGAALACGSLAKRHGTLPAPANGPLAAQIDALVAEIAAVSPCPYQKLHPAVWSLRSRLLKAAKTRLRNGEREVELSVDDRSGRTVHACWDGG
jgi:hypothetical protein